MLAVAAGGLLLASAPGLSWATAGPTQPSTFGANPQEQKEDYPDDGHWAWVKQELGPKTPNTYSDPDYTFTNPFGSYEGSATSTATASASDGNASAKVIGLGTQTWGWNSVPWNIGGTASDGYNVQWTSVWVDPDDPDGQDTVAAQSGSATASGGGSLAIGTSAAADSGSSASSSASLSGKCSAPALNIGLPGREIACDSQYSSAASALGRGGNIGAKVADNATHVSGSFSEEEMWAANGQGSASGTASYTVTPQTSQITGTAPATVTESGTAVASGSGAGSDPGAAQDHSSSSVYVSDPPSGD